MNINWLQRSKVTIFIKEIENTFSQKISLDKDCHCVFRLNFDITFLDEEFADKYDTLLISRDSLSIIEQKLKVVDFTIKGGEEWTKWLNQAQKDYFENKSKGEFQTANTKKEMSRKVRRSKDSIYIVIYSYLNPTNKPWLISYNSEKKLWESDLPLSFIELRDLIDALKAIPKHPKNDFYGYYIEDVFIVEMKVGNQYRRLSVYRPFSHYKNEIWLDAEYIRLIELLKK